MLNTHALKNYSSIKMECEFPVIMHQWVVLFLFICSFSFHYKIQSNKFQTPLLQGYSNQVGCTVGCGKRGGGEERDFDFSKHTASSVSRWT